MSTGWAIFVGVTLVGFAIGFFFVGFVVGEDTAREELDDHRTRLLETERALRDIDRAVFISMLGAAEAKGRDGATPRSGPGLPERSKRGDL